VGIVATKLRRTLASSFISGRSIGDRIPGFCPSLRLAPGDTFTFFPDGVVEAQSPTGELFGFERTGSISRQSAQEIADVAQAFGQEDDITVLTLQFAPA
jgi:Stage II sporulation protein E (SpoIIE)